MKYLLIPIFFALAKAQNSCTGVPDGTVVTWGCRAYTTCQDEQPVIIDCSVNGQVYNPKIKACDDEENTPAPCGSSRATACAKAVEGRFADWTEDCKFYYTCNDGLYYGHNPCPEGTVFDEVYCLCNYKESVYPPCGTKPDDDNKPTGRGCPL